MNSFQLKLIACALMVIDHVGYIFFPEIVWFRIIGRLSMPIFAFLIGQGFKHTKHLNRYLITLLAFAFLSQPIYELSINSGFNNIFFLLFLSLAGLTIFERIKSKIIGFGILFLLAILSSVIGIEYGFYGVMMVFILGHFDIKTQMPKMLIWVAVITAIEIAGTLILAPTNALGSFNIWHYLQIFAIPSLLILMFYNGERGPSYKYFFYLFYPGHLAILAVIKHLI